MRIAITARGSHPSSEVDECFGRAYWVLIFETKTGNYTAINNSEIRNSQENAGVKAAKLLENKKVDVLLTGETGPKAFRSLVEKGIKVFHGASGSVEEALNTWLRGEMKEAEHANSPGSPYCLVVQSKTTQVDAPKVLLDLLKT
ncbi:MAG: NifB/NifX family molybdenum-iron cluster-binding protein [Desulfuromonadales bacterium]|nr:NifB/NifX family molybdenum-iron cluster-binding protein [Desulfuromonadales bacterium]MDW7756109.1 NifB/NifX family molybdenum-iron cluster-binding protein [Desulfuromonadales bacterium]